MHETGMQEQIGNQLIEVEITGHEKVKASDICKVNTTQLKNVSGYECDQVYDQQVFGDRGYAEHHCYFSLFYLLFENDLTFLFWAQNYENNLFYASKCPQIILFFIKKVIFSHFLLFLSRVSIIFAQVFPQDRSYYY
jgi:hypothetical protein